MDRHDELDEFVRRATELLRPIVEEYVSPKEEWQKKYAQTEKGREVFKKGWKKRAKIMKELKNELSLEDLQNIKQFYRNTPKGYEVDHIIPISRGGKHCLSNLQYLTKEENARKFNRLPDDPIGGW